MKALIYDYTSGRRVLRCVVRLGADGRAIIEGPVPRSIEMGLAAISQTAETGEEFLRRIPVEFSGTYIRGRLVED